MDLSKLVAPEGEKTVLMVGEDHDQPMLEEMLALCEAFRPDAVAVENDSDTFPFRDEVLVLAEIADTIAHHEDQASESMTAILKMAGKGIPAMPAACIYAAKKNLPLYLADWQPLSPSSIGDYFLATKQKTAAENLGAEHPWADKTYMDKLDTLKETIVSLYGKEAMRDADRYARWFLFKELGLLWTFRRSEEEKALARFVAYYESAPVLQLRNEYTTMVLNSLPETRILYVGGTAHFRPDSFLWESGQRSGSVVPLQQLVKAEHRFYVEVDELCSDDYPIKINETKDMKLPWHLLDYIQDNGGSR